MKSIVVFLMLFLLADSSANFSRLHQDEEQDRRQLDEDLVRKRFFADFKDIDPLFYRNESSSLSAAVDSLGKKKMPVTRGVHQVKSLYENLKYGNKIFEDPKINTIRYIPSIKVDLDKKFYFIFNLSQLTDTEQLLKTELYINNRYVRLKLAFDLYYFFHSKNDTKNLDVNRHNKNEAAITIDLTNTRNLRHKKQNGWQIFNIANSLGSFMNAKKSQEAFVSKFKNLKNGYYNKTVYFTFDNNYNQNQNQLLNLKGTNDELILFMETSLLSNKKHKNLPSESFNPYLIVYTNEDESKMKNFFKNRLPSALVSDSLDDSEMLLKSSDLDASWSTFNKHDIDDVSDLKKFEEEVDQMNRDDSTSFLATDLNLFKPGANKFNDLIDSPPKVKSTTKKTTAATTATTTTTPTSTTTSNSRRLDEEKYNFYGFFGKNNNQLANIVHHSVENQNEIKFIIDDSTLNLAPLQNNPARKSKRNAANDPTNQSLDRKKLSPSLDDIYDDSEFEQKKQQQQPKQRPLNSRLNDDADEDDKIDRDEYEEENEADDDDDDTSKTFDNTKWLTNESSSKKASFKCKTQPISIDFVDLSFSDWIIEPKSYQSNYCAGNCRFPKSEKLTSSNYATLQGILNILNINAKNTPSELCCSPTRTESLPILYIDRNQIDHVVKLLPDMIVKDCGCN